jgi:hypothetical protein
MDVIAVDCFALCGTSTTMAMMFGAERGNRKASIAKKFILSMKNLLDVISKSDLHFVKVGRRFLFLVLFFFIF